MHQYQPFFRRMPPDRTSRWNLLRSYASLWYPVLGSECGIPEDEVADVEHKLGMALPLALKEFYRLAGRRSDIWSKQDRLVSFSEFGPTPDNAFIFLVENQGCERWGIRGEHIHLDDPPVHRFEEEGLVSDTFSAFTLAMLLYDIKFSGHPSVGEQGVSNLYPEVEEKFSRCAVPEKFWIEDVEPIEYYEGDGVVVEIQRGQEAMWVTCNRLDAYEQFSLRARRGLGELR